MLLLGRSGMLAQAVARCAPKLGFEVSSMSRIDGFNLSEVSTNEQLTSVFNRLKPNLIVNAAALTNLDFCESNPAQAWMLNAHLPALIAKMTSQVQCPWIHISTDHYFNGQENKLHTENDNPNPPNIYAASKLAGEVMALTSPTALVIRTNIVGRRGWINQPNFLEWVMNCLTEEKPFDAYIDTWTSSIEVDQFATLAIILSENRDTGLFNLACLNSISKAEMIEKVANRFKLSAKYMNKVKTPNHNSANTLNRANSMGLDCSKAQKKLLELGYSLPNTEEVIEALYKSFSEY
jgi:dTDP-4-dehydrorhamnose reductase